MGFTTFARIADVIAAQRPEPSPLRGAPVPHDFPDFARNLTDVARNGPAYSFCTLVSRPALYAQMLDSFQAAGFTPADCEFLYIDNSATNQGDGYQGLNRLIAAARGRYIVLCHQDLLAIAPRTRLDESLAELDALAPDWAVVGNSGHDDRGRKRHRLTDRHGFDMTSGPLPGRVVSLDENFVLIRRDASLGFSHDLSGFHIYATDLCLQADLRGRSAWVVDFHLEHLGQGRVDASFAACMSGFSQKYRRALRSRTIITPSVRLSVGRFDPAAWLRAYKLRNTVDGKRPFSAVRALRQRIKALPHDLREVLNGPRFALGGTVFTIPPRAPLDLRKALRRGTYAAPKRAMIAKWLPRDLPVVELGGSYGIVSHTIRRHIAPTSQLLVVQSDPALLPLCTANVALAGHTATTRVIGAALAHGTDAPPLARLLADNGITGDFSLVCNIDGAEYDLLLHDSASLARCAMIVMHIHPAAFIDRGSSVSAFCQMLTAAGFTLIDHQAQVIAARR